jgi:hypothetical protein
MSKLSDWKTYCCQSCGFPVVVDTTYGDFNQVLIGCGWCGWDAIATFDEEGEVALDEGSPL